jgi:hypothetical protein
MISKPLQTMMMKYLLAEEDECEFIFYPHTDTMHKYGSIVLAHFDFDSISMSQIRFTIIATL